MSIIIKEVVAKEMAAVPVSPDSLDNRVSPDNLVNQANLVSPDNLVNQEIRDNLVIQDMVLVVVKGMEEG